MDYEWKAIVNPSLFLEEDVFLGAYYSVYASLVYLSDDVSNFNSEACIEIGNLIFNEFDKFVHSHANVYKQANIALPSFLLPASLLDAIRVVVKDNDKFSYELYSAFYYSLEMNMKIKQIMLGRVYVPVIGEDDDFCRQKSFYVEQLYNAILVRDIGGLKIFEQLDEELRIILAHENKKAPH
jgi:hypothetical protein